MKGLLELSALILSIINGLVLFSQWLHDKPRIAVDPIHPDVYQWWFRLPDGKHESRLTRRWGFLLYVGINNTGAKGCSISRFRLKIRRKQPLLGRRIELRSVNIPQPQMIIGGHKKMFPVLGQRTQHFDGEMHLPSGDSLSGMACYIYEVWGDASWNPRMTNNGCIKGLFEIRNVFGQRAKCKIIFRQTEIAQIREMLPGIEEFEHFWR